MNKGNKYNTEQTVVIRGHMEIFKIVLKSDGCSKRSIFQMVCSCCSVCGFILNAEESAGAYFSFPGDNVDTMV